VKMRHESLVIHVGNNEADGVERKRDHIGKARITLFLVAHSGYGHRRSKWKMAW
jgi:hypothetical protein